jgi:protein-disulfide isomerase
MPRFRAAVLTLSIAGAMLTASPVSLADGFTNDQVKELLNELKLIRQALEKQAAAQPSAPGAAAPVDDKVSMAFISTRNALGRADAPLVMVEYTDYQCPFCQRFHNTTWTELKKNWIDTGKVRFISRDFPLPFHENARRAAVASHCGAEQGKFWELRHTMIVNAEKLQSDRLPDYAKEAGLDVGRFNACLAADKYKEDIDKSYAEGLAAGINGTPSFIVGQLRNDRLEGVRMVGAMPYAMFDAKLKQMLDQVARN